MKKLIGLFIVTCAIFTRTHADDCGMQGYNLQDWQHENIFPKVAMEKALGNLKKFCCSNDTLKWTLDCSTANVGWNFPQSKYLFDHILDIWLRRLDAKIENENGENLIYGLNPDTIGSEWREFITSHANSPQGSVPLDIVNKYKQYREIKWNSLTRWSPNASMPWTVDDFEDYNNWSLWEKYIWMCESSIYLYWIMKWEDNLDKARISTIYPSCRNLINTRIQNEYDYTKAILMQKWNTLLRININTYLSNYFSQNKMTELLKLIFNINNTFNEVNRGVKELVLKCS